MTKAEAKQVLSYLNQITDKMTTRNEFEKLADIMAIIEKEIEK